MSPQNENLTHIEESWSQEELDSYLKRSYGYSLFDFALSLAVVFRRNPPFRLFNIWRLKRGTFDTLRDFQRKAAGLERLRASIIRRLSEHLEDVGYWGAITEGVENPLFPTALQTELGQTRLNGELTTEERQRITKRLYGLGRLDEAVDSELSHYESLFTLYASTHSGRPALVKTIISSFWSYVLRKRDRVDADAIVELLNWFLARIRDTAYGRAFYRSVRSGYPGSEEISRFKRRFRSQLREDLGQIFRYNLLENPDIQEPRVLRIRFDNDEPRFYKIQASEDTVSLPIIFP